MNLASRLEGANKVHGSRLMVAEATLAGCAERFETRELDILRVKGKSEGARVYEVLGVAGSLSPEAARLRDGFEAALAEYRSGRCVPGRAAPGGLGRDLEPHLEVRLQMGG